MLIFNHLQKHNFRVISGLFRYIAHFLEQTWTFINLYTHKNKDNILINLHFFLQIRIFSKR